MKKNRAWVKWAAIGFFAIMALLTFFSGTIRNLTLPEVTTQPVTPGTISPVVACGGITEAGPPIELLATRAGTVTKVLVKAGDRVKTGDVLIRVDYPDDGSLAALQVQLAQQEAAFAEAQLSASAPTDSGAWAEYQILKNNLDDAQQRQTRCQEYTGKRSSLNSQLSAANKELDAAQNAYHTAVDAAAQEAEAAHQALNAARNRQENAQANESYYASDPESEEYLAAKAELEAANAEVLECQNRCYPADNALQALQAQYQPAVDAAQMKVEAANNQISSLEMEYAGCTDAMECENAVLSAKSAISAWYDRRKNTQVQDELTAARLTAMEAEIEQTKQEISRLESGIGGGEILASRDGIVVSVLEKERFEQGELLATLRSGDACTLRCSVPMEEAVLLRTGTEARITNQSGGIVQIQLTAIEPDETDPTYRKCLVFSVTGDDAVPNQYYTLTVSLEPSRHDLVVPNAAVFQDSMGDFVYVVDTKNTPLGSRSKVRRVGVEVLRQDDRYTAVTGELDKSSYVVVMSSGPLSDGQGVRFGDD